MKYLLFVAIAMCCTYSNKIQAQDYNYAIGIKQVFKNSSNPYFTGKMFLDENSAIETNLGFISTANLSLFVIYGAYQYHFDSRIDGLRPFVGIGPGLAIVRSRGSSSSSTSLLARGYVGVEYTFDSLPINAGVTWEPSRILSQENNSTLFTYDIVTLAIRYAF